MRIMKFRSVLTLIVFVLLVSACSAAEEPTLEPTFESYSFQFLNDGAYQALLPTWEKVDVSDPNILTMLVKDGQHILIHRFQGPPALITEQFLTEIDNDPDSYLVLQEERDGKAFFEFTSRENQQTLRNQAVLDYCQGQTYALVAGGIDTVANADLFTQVLASASCENEFQVPDLDTGKIGMRVNPLAGDYWEGYYPALRLAKESGVQVLHTYLAWGVIEEEPGEYNWEWNDALMDFRFQEGFEVSLVVNVIHTTLRGSMPEDLKEQEFNDPEMIQRFTDFILAALKRYPVKYLSIGNEVNDYFISHRDEIAAYKEFFLAVKDAVQIEYPDLMMGMTFAYHDAEILGGVDIVRELNVGDFLPVTLYIYSSGFQFDRDPIELDGYLDRILALKQDQSIAIVEVGWNTGQSISGNQEDQAEFVRELFRQLADHRERIEFVSWFQLHDGVMEESDLVAESFLPKNSHLLEDDEFMESFVVFLNDLGLIENDGTPKLAWPVFQEEAQAYLESID